jgi:hypothetical protein
MRGGAGGDSGGDAGGMDQESLVQQITERVMAALAQGGPAA